MGCSPGVILELRELDRNSSVRIQDRTSGIKVQDLLLDNEERQLRVLPLRVFTTDPDSLNTTSPDDNWIEEEKIKAIEETLQRLDQ